MLINSAYLILVKNLFRYDETNKFKNSILAKNKIFNILLSNCKYN